MPMSRISRTITFSLPPEMAEQVRGVMKEEGRTMSELLREALRLYMEEREWRRTVRYERLKARQEEMESQDVERPVGERPEGHPPIAQCVAGALINDGKVLLVKRSPQGRFYPDVWDLFGGHIGGEESSEDALRREALEELQVEIESFHLLGTIHDPVEPAEIMVFAVSTWKGEPVNAAPDEHSQIGWFSADGLPRSEGLDAYRELVVQAIARSADGFPG